MDRGRGLDYLLVALLAIFVIGTVYYWLSYFLIGGVQVLTDIWYVRFENAFPVADAWASLASLFAIYYLLRKSPLMAPFFLGVSGAAMLYLACMDITFDVQNGLYSLVASNSSMQTELVINIFSVVVSVLALFTGFIRLRSQKTSG